MLRAMIGGFLLGPVILVGVALLWSKATLVVLILLLMLAIVTVASVMAAPDAPPPRQPTTPAPPPGIGNVTLTSTRAGVRANASENLASANRWRSAFTGWRYRPPTR